MSLSDFLILQRIYSVLELIHERLDTYLEEEVCRTLDADKAVVEGLWSFGIRLVSEFSIHIFEVYAVESFRLVISRYNYALLQKEMPILSCDNTPHHAGVSVFPHHKHRYPKDQFKPIAFSGQVEDFLEDALWELHRREAQSK